MKKDTQQNSTDSTLSPKQIEVIEALASGASVSEAARRAGVDRSTIYLWREEDSDFEAQLTLARRECADSMRARLRELVDDAVKTIRETMSGTDIPPAVRLKAALSIVQFAARDDSAGEAAALQTWRRHEFDPLVACFASAR